MRKALLSLTACFGFMLLTSPGAHAQNCWWTPEGYRCHQGWFREHGREWSDYERREERERMRREWHLRHPLPLDGHLKWDGR